MFTYYKQTLKKRVTAGIYVGFVRRQIEVKSKLPDCSIQLVLLCKTELIIILMCKKEPYEIFSVILIEKYILKFLNHSRDGTTIPDPTLVFVKSCFWSISGWTVFEAQDACIYHKQVIL